MSLSEYYYIMIKYTLNVFKRFFVLKIYKYYLYHKLSVRIKEEIILHFSS